MVTGAQRDVWGTASWLEPRGAGGAAMGREAGNRVGTGIMEGPEYQVSSLGFLLQTAGSLLARAELSFGEWQWGKMEGGGRRAHGEVLAGCWGLTAEARAGLCAAVVLTLYLSLLSASKPEKPRLGSALPTLRYQDKLVLYTKAEIHPDSSFPIPSSPGRG